MMKTFPLLLLGILACFSACTVANPPENNALISGIAWFDQHHQEVNAHGACIVREGDRYYLFGEYKSDTSNRFNGFGCYSSPDLVHWQFERIALAVQPEGLLGPNRVGERVKVMKCPSTGEYVMYMHCDDMGYRDPHIGYATSPTIDGEYTFRGAILMDGEPIRKWDMGVYQETDGKGYLLTHSGFIYALSEDYRSVERIVVQDVVHGESPALFKHKGTYYWLFSNLTNWERNDNFYLTAPALEGPWTERGLLAPEGTMTWNSQTTYVLPIAGPSDTLFLFMGDRWSYPMQGSAATYVWQPILLSDNRMILPDYQPAWEIDLSTASWRPAEVAVQKLARQEITPTGNWEISEQGFRSNEKGASLSCTLKGQQILVRGFSDTQSGYAQFTLTDQQGVEVLSTVVDGYSQYETPTILFKSPRLAEGVYTLKIEVLGAHFECRDKRGNVFGSSGNDVSIGEIGTL